MNIMCIMSFPAFLQHQPQLFELQGMFFPAFQQINARRVDRRMAQQVGQL